MRTMSPDGYLRLKARELDRIPLQHLISKVDDEAPSPLSCCGAPTALSGYTEWVCPDEPALSIGWDWELRRGPGASGMVRLGLPRTNILLVSEASHPLQWEVSLEVLAHFVDAMDWQHAAFDAALRDGTVGTAATYKN